MGGSQMALRKHSQSYSLEEKQDTISHLLVWQKKPPFDNTLLFVRLVNKHQYPLLVAI